MAMKLYNETDVQNIADSIRAKNGTQDTYKVSEMSTAIDNLPSGGNVVNGIIEQYKAESGTIDANTFVEFVNHYIDNTLVNTSERGANIFAVLIDTNKVFIAHQSDNTNQYLNGMVCTINGTTITKGADIQLTTIKHTGNTIKAVALSDSKVFITNQGSSSYGYLAGMVCTISGTTITAGTNTRLSDNTGSYMGTSLVLIDTNKVFIAHRNSASDSSLAGTICTISGTTITKDNSTILVSDNFYSGSSAVLIDTNKVFIAHQYSPGGLYGMVCTISGTTIGKGRDTSLVSAAGSDNYASAVLIDTNKVFIAHQSDNTNQYLNGMVCTINGTTITKGADIQLSSDTHSGNAISLVLIDTNKVFIAHQSDNTNQYLNGIVCTINDTTITAGTDTSLVSAAGSDNYASAVLIDTNKVFIAHQSDSTNQYLNGMIVYISNMDVITDTDHLTVKPSTSNIQGLTKDECTTSTAGDVFVLDN